MVGEGGKGIWGMSGDGAKDCAEAPRFNDSPE